MYGGMTFVHYLIEEEYRHDETPLLSQTPHYPFHAVRSGSQLFSQFLNDLGFGDHVGLVSYNSVPRVETRIRMRELT